MSAKWVSYLTRLRAKSRRVWGSYISVSYMGDSTLRRSLFLVVFIWRHLYYVNYDHFAPNFDVTYKTIQRVPVPNLKLFGPMKTELWAKEVTEFSVMLYGKMNWSVCGNRRKERHRFRLRLRQAVILISNIGTSPSKKINLMVLIWILLRSKEPRKNSMTFGRLWWTFFCPSTWLPQYKRIEIF